MCLSTYSSKQKNLAVCIVMLGMVALPVLAADAAERDISATRAAAVMSFAMVPRATGCAVGRANQECLGSEMPLGLESRESLFP